MSEFKDKIRAAGSKVEFLYDPGKGVTENQGLVWKELFKLSIEISERAIVIETRSKLAGFCRFSAFSPAKPEVIGFVLATQRSSSS